MKITDLPDFVEHFRMRVLQDALNEATAAYWLRRAETFEAARPALLDFHGEASSQEISDRYAALSATAMACRNRAKLALGGRP